MLEKAMISGVTTRRRGDRLPRRGRRARRELFAGARRGARSTSTRSLQIGTGDRLLRAGRGPGAAAAARSSGSASRWTRAKDLGKVSVVGAGMKSHPGIAAKTFGTLADIGVESHFVSHLPDQDRLLRPARGRRARRQGAARGVRPRPPASAETRSMPSASASSAPPAPSARSSSSCSPSAATTTSASSPRRSAGTRVPFGSGELEVEDASPETLDRRSTSASSPSGPRRAPSSSRAAVANGAVCVDKSSAFRLTDGIPLVVPEVNGARAGTSTTASSPTRTAPPSSSSASSSRCDERPG